MSFIVASLQVHPVPCAQHHCLPLPSPLVPFRFPVSLHFHFRHTHTHTQLGSAYETECSVSLSLCIGLISFPSVFLPMTSLYPSFWLNKTLLCVYTTFSLCFHEMTGIRLAPCLSYCELCWDEHGCRVSLCCALRSLQVRTRVWDDWAV